MASKISGSFLPFTDVEALVFDEHVGAKRFCEAEQIPGPIGQSPEGTLEDLFSAGSVDELSQEFFAAVKKQRQGGSDLEELSSPGAEIQNRRAFRREQNRIAEANARERKIAYEKSLSTEIKALSVAILTLANQYPTQLSPTGSRPRNLQDFNYIQDLKKRYDIDEQASPTIEVSRITKKYQNTVAFLTQKIAQGAKQSEVSREELSKLRRDRRLLQNRVSASNTRRNRAIDLANHENEREQLQTLLEKMNEVVRLNL